MAHGTCKVHVWEERALGGVDLADEVGERVGDGGQEGSRACKPANKGSSSSWGGRSKPSAQLNSCEALGVLLTPLPTSLPPASGCPPDPPLCPPLCPLPGFRTFTDRSVKKVTLR